MGWVLDLGDKMWPVTRRLMAGHTALYKATNGRVGHTFPGFPTMLLLDHVGARSGVRRTAPLLYVADGEDLVIVASKGGFPKHPAWFHNLKANPDTTVQVGREKRAVRARVADETERARLWPKAVASYKGYRDYQERSKGRTIPMVILSPR
ncbi:MAG: nitroreductase family deazaflavin-dependent oxidoreductase [Solirubrobacteraceae bacterium]